MSDNIEFKNGHKSHLIPGALIISILTTCVSTFNSCMSNNATINNNITQLSTKVDNIQKDVSDLKQAQKELNEKVIKDNQDLTNRLTIVEVKGGVK